MPTVVAPEGPTGNHTCVRVSDVQQDKSLQGVPASTSLNTKYAQEALLLAGAVGVQADLGVRPHTLSLAEGLEALTVNGAHQNLTREQLQGRQTPGGASPQLKFSFSNVVIWSKNTSFLQ